MLILTSYFNIGKIFLTSEIACKRYFIQLIYIGFLNYRTHGKMKIERVEFWFFLTHALIISLFISDLSLCLSIFLQHTPAFIHTQNSKRYTLILFDRMNVRNDEKVWNEIA